MTSNRLCLLVATWIVLMANQTFWSLLLQDQVEASDKWLFTGSIAVALIGLHLFLLRVLSPGRTIRWMISVLLVIAVVTGWFMDTYGVAVDSGMLRNVVETDFAESRDFLGLPLLWRLGWQAVLPLILIWRAPLAATSWGHSLRDYVSGSFAGLALILLVGLPMYSHYASFFRNQESARYLIGPANVVVGSVNLVRKGIRGRQPYVQVGHDARRVAQIDRKPLLLVVVVGETARAANFSLGGYARNTNPLLQKRDVFYFSDVSSCGTATAMSVPCMFSDLPRVEFELSKASQRDNVLDILQRTGLSVSWIDNQSGCKHVCARVPTRSAEEDHPESCSAGECLDDALLYALDRDLKSLTDDSVIVLHMMGSHGPTYHRRVPPDHEAFRPTCPTERIETCTTEQIVNAYDNSIAYTDVVLAGLIDRLAARKGDVDSVLLYVSDHGESLGENGLYLHGQPYIIAPEVQRKVPMLWWFSAGAFERLNLNTACLRGKLAAAVSHDNVSHTLLGIGGVKTSAYRPGLDLFRSCQVRVRDRPTES